MKVTVHSSPGEWTAKWRGGSFRKMASSLRIRMLRTQNSEMSWWKNMVGWPHRPSSLAMKSS